MITGAPARVMNHCNEALMSFCDYLSIGGLARCVYVGEFCFKGSFSHIRQYVMLHPPVNLVAFVLNS